jgi:C4-dicarboxylate-specific signal transduction histidine kinase
MVIGNAIQLEQVFINLLTNARDAVASSPRRMISIDCAIGADFAELSLSDTGPGIPNGMEQRIFDPFFTTKEVGKGTGLGLSITYGILKEHHGTITAAKKPTGEGATFVVQLPLDQAASRES